MLCVELVISGGISQRVSKQHLLSVDARRKSNA